MMYYYGKGLGAVVKSLDDYKRKSLGAVKKANSAGSTCSLQNASRKRHVLRETGIEEIEIGRDGVLRFRFTS